MVAFLSTVLAMMLHNQPLLEAVVIAPLLLKRFSWVLVACLLVGIGTFGAELHNTYDLAVWFAGPNLALLGAQLAIAIAVSAAIFAVKGMAIGAMGAGRKAGAPEAGDPSTHP